MKAFKIAFIVILVTLWCVPAVRADGDLDASYYLWRIINEVRVDPMGALERLGIEEATARQALGPDQWILDEGLPPLARHQSLYDSALGHAEDMIRNLYYAYNSLDGTTPVERVEATGYEAIDTGESLGALAFNVFVERFEAARLILENMLRDELDPANPSRRNILNPYLTEVGVAFRSAVLRLGNDLPVNIYLTVSDFGRPVEPKAYLIGNVYDDPEGTGSFRPPAGLPGLEVILRAFDRDAEFSMLSGPLGAYQFEIPQDLTGPVVIEARDADGNVLANRGILPGETNSMVDLPIKSGFPSPR
jgi:hypothetical protein